VLGDNLNISNASSALLTISGPITMNANSITFSGTGTGGVSMGGVLSGTGGTILSGPGTVILGGANTFTGASTINAGILKIDAESRLGNNPASFNASQLQLNGGTLEHTATFSISESNRGITV